MHISARKLLFQNAGLLHCRCNYHFAGQEFWPAAWPHLYNRYFYRVLDALQIPRRNLYAARHTLLTRSVSHGYDIPRIAQQVGNSQKMTERVYLHKLPGTFYFPMWEF